MHATELTRAATNRANAQHSTGPRTPAGKARSSRNAVTHGLNARSPILPTENPEEYRQHCRQFLDEYQPATPTETHLTQDLADAAWRLQRIPLLEAALLAGNSPQETVRDLANLDAHSQRLARQFHKILKELRALQTERIQRRRHDLNTASALLRLHEKNGAAFDPAEHGFVFSKSEIECHATRKDRHHAARQLDLIRFSPVPEHLRDRSQPR